MLGWLGEWLQSIVVVVLLAIVVELVLPNSKMLRYSRLVVGLILLLTILNPVLQVFQVDFQDKLHASFSQWEKELNAKQSEVLSLEQITKEAELLKQQREGAALDVTRASIEQSMQQELQVAVDANIVDVSLEIGWDEAAGKQPLPYIASVTVTIAEQQQEAERSNEIESVAEVAIEDISIPAISTGIAQQADEDSESPAPKQHVEANEQAMEQFHKHAKEIVTILSSGWNVKADHIFVQASN